MWTARTRPRADGRPDPTLGQPVRGLVGPFLLGGLFAGIPVGAVALFRPATAIPLVGGLV